MTTDRGAEVSEDLTNPNMVNALADEWTMMRRNRLGPNQPPKDAATLILVDRSGKTPKVLMGKRHPNLKFMPGKFVFPGGRLDAADRAMSAAGALDAAVEDKLLKLVQRPSISRARALALAAIRETFEETGIAIGSRDYGAPEIAPEGVWKDFAAQGVFPTLDALHFIARAITPPGRPRRFDTRFFSADANAIACKVEGIVGPDSELVELVWMPVTEADRLDLPVITRVVLKELENRVAAGFSHRLPAPFYFERYAKLNRVEL